MRVTTAQFAVVVVSLLGLTGCKMSNPFAKKDAASSTALANAPAYKPGNTGANSAANQRPSANATASTLGGSGSTAGTGGYKMSPNYGAPSGGSSSSYPIATNNTSYGAPQTGGATPGYQQPVTPASYDNQYPKTGFASAQNIGTTPGSAAMTNPYTQSAAAGAQVGNYDSKGYNAGSGFAQQPPAGGAMGRDPYQSNSANTYVTGADPYKTATPNNTAAATPDYRTADVSKPYTGATRTDYSAGTPAGGNASGGGVPSFGSADPYLTQSDSYNNSPSGAGAGKSAELPTKPSATTPKNDYNPGATGYNPGATGFNPGNTGYGSGATGYNVPPSYTTGANGSTPATTATGSSPYRPGGTSDFKPAGGGVTQAPANGSWNTGAPAAGAGAYNPPASSAPATTPNAQFGGSAAAGYGNGF